MRRTAILHAESVVRRCSRRIGREPQIIRVVRDEITLAGERRDPKRVNHVLGLEREVHRASLRQIELVGRDDGVELSGWASLRELRIAKLPPPLMADDLDLQCVAATFRLCAEDRPYGRDGDEHEDHRGHDRPRDLECRVAMDMLGLPGDAASPKTHERINQDRFDDNKDDRAEPDQDLKEKPNVAIGICAGMEDRIRIWAASGNDQRGGRQRYRQRGTSEPARAESMMHALSCFRRAVRRWRFDVMSCAHGTHGLEQRQGTG